MKWIPYLTKIMEKWISPFPFFIKIYGLYYKEMVEQEIQLGEISCYDRVLCIGGGPIPCTALEIASRTGAKVQMVDMDPIAVEIAKRVISRLDMSQKVEVVLAAGQQVDASSFSVVHVARQAFPHQEIFKNVWARIPGGARVLMRTPDKSLRELDPISNGICNCRQCKRIRPKRRKKVTLLFTKEIGGMKGEKVYSTVNNPSIHRSTSMVC